MQIGQRIFKGTAINVLQFFPDQFPTLFLHISRLSYANCCYFINVYSPVVFLRTVYRMMMCFCAARNAIIVIIASSMAAVLYHHDIKLFSLTGNITSGIPQFKPPSFTLTHDNHTYTVQDFFEVTAPHFVLRQLVILEARALR